MTIACYVRRGGAFSGLALPLAALLTACPPDLEDSLEPGDDDKAPAGVIDAGDAEAWVSYDLDAETIVEESDPSWDLGFRRFEVRINGGVSGTGPVEAAILDGVDYDTLTEAPADGYLVDEPDADADGIDERVFDGWYTYDYVTHLLSPNEVIYVVHTTEGDYHKIVFDDYYDDAGTPAQISFRADPVTAPAGAR